MLQTSGVGNVAEHCLRPKPSHSYYAGNMRQERARKRRKKRSAAKIVSGKAVMIYDREDALYKKKP